VDPFNDRHSPATPYGHGQAASPAPLNNGQQHHHLASSQGPGHQQQQQGRPTGYALHDNPSYGNSMQTLPMDSTYSLNDNKLDYDGGVYPDEEVESKTPLRSEFGIQQGPYDQDQPL
jgi:hypothetical protein